MQTRTHRGEGGFTLIELMVVVLVIGILMAIAIPTFFGATSRSEDAVAKSSLKLLLREGFAVSAADGFQPIDVSPAALKKVEPSLDYVEGDQASDGPKQLSVGQGEYGVVGMAARSESGTCFLIFATGDENGPRQYYGSVQTDDCTGNRAMSDAHDNDW